MEETKTLCVISKKENKEKMPRLSVSDIYSTAIRVIGILLSRAMPIGGFAPFGVSFLTVERRFTKASLITAAMTIIGYISLWDIEFAAKYIFAIFLYMVFLFAQKGIGFDVSPAVSICASGIAVAIGRASEMILVGASIGGALQIVCDAGFTVIGAVAFEKSRGILKGRKSRLFSMNKEEKLYAAILVAIAIMGAKSIGISDFFYAANVAGLWIVAIFSLCGGISAVLCGAVVGVILGIGGALLETIAVFTICSAVGGFLSKYGKTSVCVGVSVSAAIAAIYCAEGGVMVFGYLDIPLTALFVLLTSDYSVRSIGRISGVGTKNANEGQCREFVKSRLNSASESFRILAETFLDLSDKHNRVDMEDISMMFDKAAERVCKRCSRAGECWVTGFNSTYKSMFRMLEIMERKGELIEDDADGFFADRCLRLRSMVREMNRLFEIYKINCVWKSKLAENRELAGQQLGSVAQILCNIAQDISEEEPDGSVEEEIRMRISDKGVDISTLNVTVNAKGRYSAYISGFGDAEAMRRSAEGALRSVLGVRLVTIGRLSGEGGEVMLRLAEPEGYRIESGVARIGKTEESGDNCAIRYLSDGKFAAALSDGMGTGHRASRDSGATVKLLGDFLEAGFDKTIAVRLVNSIMVMKSANEAFATVDMCVIDLYSGEIEFVKNGAEPSYIKRREGTETVRSASLPIGVMQDMEIESFARKVDAGDVVVMMSDGLQMKKGHEEWIKKVIDEAEPSMPSKELADRLIEMATAIKGDEADDDMTVVVLKVCKTE